MLTINIGLIGVGTIGTFLLEKINKEKFISGYQITAVFDEREKAKDKLQHLASTYDFQPYQNIDRFLDSSIDVVVECANIDVVKQLAEQIIQKKDLFLISVGALVDPIYYDQLQGIATTEGRKIYLPTGAIGGLDVIKAANILGGLQSVTLITRKPAQALAGDLIEEETVLFEGKAKDAIAQFPKNANVAIILSLSGIGVEKTKVKIIADPAVDKNIHCIETVGDFGKVEIKLENNPSPTNPKTSYLTALSILSSLKSLDEAVTIG